MREKEKNKIKPTPHVIWDGNPYYIISVTENYYLVSSDKTKQNKIFSIHVDDKRLTQTPEAWTKPVKKYRQTDALIRYGKD